MKVIRILNTFDRRHRKWPVGTSFDAALAYATTNTSIMFIEWQGSIVDIEKYKQNNSLKESFAYRANNSLHGDRPTGLVQGYKIKNGFFWNSDDGRLYRGSKLKRYQFFKRY